MSDEWLDQIKWSPEGLVPVIVQDQDGGKVLMFAWMNREALAETLCSRQAVFWSRSRGRLWRKGEQSGHVQTVSEIRLDCDADCILLRVAQTGGIACHTGRESCFFHRLDGGKWRAVEPVLRDPADIYGDSGD